MKYKKWTEKELNILIELNKEGKSYVDISQELKGRTVTSCRLKGKSLGLEGDNNINIDFFNKDNEEKHYVLGYWLADGCIMEKSGGHYFSIVSNDVDHLKIISNIMGMKTKLYKNSNDAYEIRVGNKKLVESLISIGGKYRKTDSIKIQDLKFNGKYFNHLLRGYFDGDGNYQFANYIKKDGSKSISAIKFTGTKDLIESLYSFINLKGSLIKDTRKGESYYLMYYGNEMRKLMEYMYKDCKISLPRKLDIYNKYKLTI